MKDICEPIQFAPLFMDRMWGGGTLLEGIVTSNGGMSAQLGEIWLLSDREDAQSVVASGQFSGLTLNELWRSRGLEIFGCPKTSGSERFPLLIKLINAHEMLSLQVHPGEDDCKLLPGAQPKTEMWYVVKALEGAKIIAGFKNKAPTPEQKQEFFNSLHASEEELCESLDVYNSEEGRYFFIPAGTIHAIGGGNLILEIQQNSDTTYRVSDWGRVDKNGQARELHVEQAKLCTNFGQVVPTGNAWGQGSGKVITPANRYFKVASHTLSLGDSVQISMAGNYEILSIVSGNLVIEGEFGRVATFGLGSVFVLPMGCNFTLTATCERTRFLLYHHTVEARP